MKQIILVESQKVIANVENVSYIEKLSNGAYAPCDKERAKGISYENQTYKLYDKGNSIDGDTVIIVDIDLGDVIEKIETLNSINFVALAENEKIDEVTTKEHSNLFCDFLDGIEYKAGAIRKFNNKLFKCILTGSENPENSTYWQEILPDNDSYHEWVQPIGVLDGYSKGDIVIHNGVTYKSKIKANLTVPGSLGGMLTWEVYKSEVKEDE